VTGAREALLVRCGGPREPVQPVVTGAIRPTLAVRRRS